MLLSFRILWRALQQFSEDAASQMGAALAYYALFSTAPLLLIAVMIAGTIFDEVEVRANVLQQLTGAVGKDAAREILALMEKATRPATDVTTAVLGFGAIFAGALTMLLHVRRCLCLIWRLEPKDGGSWLWLLLNYLWAMLMALGIGLWLLLALVVSTALPLLESFAGEALPGSVLPWHNVEWLASFLLQTLLFASVYRIMSGGRVAWRHTWYGAFVTALLFTLGKTLIGFYLAYAGTASVYGAAGAIVAYLLWVYYSSQIFFFGAELVQARRTRAEWVK